MKYNRRFQLPWLNNWTMVCLDAAQSSSSFHCNILATRYTACHIGCHIWKQMGGLLRCGLRVHSIRRKSKHGGKKQALPSASPPVSAFDSKHRTHLRQQKHQMDEVSTPAGLVSSLPIICGWPSAKGINLAEQSFSDKAADTTGLLGNLLSTCRPIYAGWHLQWIAAIVIITCCFPMRCPQHGKNFLNMLQKNKITAGRIRLSFVFALANGRTVSSKIAI